MISTLLLVKLICLVVNPVETGLGVLIPQYLTAQSDSALYMSLAAALAAGIFLAVGVCHTTDDAYHFLKPTADHLHGFPLALFIVCVGFSLLLFLEKIVFAGVGHHHDMPLEGQKHGHGQGHGHGHGHGHGRGHRNAHDAPLLDPGADSTYGATAEIGAGSEPVEATPGMAAKQRFTKAVLITVSVMVHSSVSGLATGVAGNMKTLTMLAVAAFAHDWSHACALVVIYEELGITKLRQWGLLAMFVATEPTCIAVGILLTSALSDDASRLVSGVLSALAGGVFIYIAAFDLLPEAFGEPRAHGAKFALFFGFLCAIAAVAAIA